MNDKLTEIEARLNAASPGPWRTYNEGHEEEFFGSWTHIMSADQAQRETEGFCMISIDHDGPTPQQQADTALIANAPADLAWCLKEIKRLRAELDEAQYELRRFVDERSTGR